MKKNIKTKTARIISSAVLIAMVPFFSGCGTQPVVYSVSLEIWSPFDDSTSFSKIIEEYKKINPFIKEVKFRKFSVDSYRSELIDALASGNGPDIYLINNSWLPSFENKLAPAPVISEAFPTALVSEKNVSDNFPDTVKNDFVDEGKVYAVPLTVDSLQLYYNKDIFNKAFITSPPATWNDFNSAVQKTTTINGVGDITQAGAAMGAVKNINRPTDILTALMLQQGVVFPGAKASSARISDGVIGPDGNVAQGAENALQYYAEFSKLTTENGTPNPYYTWSDRNHYATDAFTEGTLGMMFNYSWQMKTIQNKNAKLNYGVAPIPQTNAKNPTTVSNYWAFGVSLNKLVSQDAVGGATGTKVAPKLPNEVRIFEAWQFLKYLTLKNSGIVKIFNAYTKNSKDFPVAIDPASEYLKNTQQPAARRDLIEIQKTDPVFGPFAAGNLIARNWAQPDPAAVETILSDAIQAVNLGNMSAHDAIGLASTKIDLLMQSR